MFQPDHFDEFEDYEELIPIRKNGRKNHRKQKQTNPLHTPKKEVYELYTELAEADEDSRDFIKTYQPSRHERAWIEESMGGFYYQRWISDILRQVKGGKEASVYLCEGHESAPFPYLAAKVYRPRHFRNLRNDHLYREGRPDLDADGNQILNGGMLHAMAQKTEYGRDLLHSSWIAYELKSMQTLHAVGANIPQPFGRSNNALLMEYIGDPDFPAPILQSIKLELPAAKKLFSRVVENIELMLDQEIIHGDLSAYNILFWDDDFKIIDFPQVVSPHQNQNTWRIFTRDVRRICEYFESQGVDTHPNQLARDLWQERGYRIRPVVNPAHLDEQNEEDYAYWKRMQVE